MERKEHEYLEQHKDLEQTTDILSCQPIGAVGRSIMENSMNCIYVRRVSSLLS